MELANILREILVSGESYTTTEITKIITTNPKYSSEWSEKKVSYENEKEAEEQLRAEVGATLGPNKRSGWIPKGRVTREKNENNIFSYTITPDYQEFLKKNDGSKFLIENEESQEELFYDDIDSLYEDDNCQDCPKEYFVYLMKSDEFDNTYKIGFTDDLVRRPKELCSLSNKVYNIFNFYVKQWVKVSSKNEMKSLEETIHGYFNKVRKYKRNGNTVDTEIFVYLNMESMFTEFIFKNYIDNEYQQGVVLDYSWK